jgi:hypothetical protein
MHPNRLGLNEEKCPYLLKHMTQHFFIDIKLNQDNPTAQCQAENQNPISLGVASLPFESFTVY